MVVAMAVMRMVQTTIDDIIGMVTMRHGVVTTSVTVFVRRLVSLACRYGRTVRGI